MSVFPPAYLDPGSSDSGMTLLAILAIVAIVVIVVIVLALLGGTIYFAMRKAIAHRDR